MTNPPPDPRRSLIAVRVLSDAVTLIVALLGAAYLRFTLGVLARTEDPSLDILPYVAAGVIWSVAIVRGLAARGMYDEDTLVAGRAETSRVWRAVLEGVAVVAFVAFLARGEELSRSWFLLAVALTAVLLPLSRMLIRRWVERRRAAGALLRPAVLVGTRAEQEELPASRIGEFAIVERLEPEALLGDQDGSDKPTVLVDGNGMDEDTLWEVVMTAGERGSSVFMMSSLRAVPTERVTMRDLAGRTVMRVAPPRIAGIRAAEKRVLDLVVVAVLLLPSIVVGGVVALVALATTGRPVFYRQERLGRDGRVFRMWKFRSMQVDAEAETGPVWTDKADPRRTRLGRFLRRSSIDELPQLWNVIRGDMSMVGPRPERPEFVDRFSAEMRWYRYRLRIKPGVTGLAQALGFRGLSPLDARIERDNWYIEHWSLGLDLQILVRTIGAVLRGTNAE